MFEIKDTVGNVKIDFINKKLKDVNKYFDAKNRKTIQHNFDIILNEVVYFKKHLKEATLINIINNCNKLEEILFRLNADKDYIVSISNTLTIMNIYLQKIWETNNVNYPNAILWKDRFKFLLRYSYMQNILYFHDYEKELYLSKYAIDEDVFREYVNNNPHLSPENKKLRFLTGKEDYLFKIINSMFDSFDKTTLIDETTPKQDILRLIDELNVEHKLVRIIDPFEDDCNLTN